MAEEDKKCSDVTEESGADVATDVTGAISSSPSKASKGSCIIDRGSSINYVKGNTVTRCDSGERRGSENSYISLKKHIFLGIV